MDTPRPLTADDLPRLAELLDSVFRRSRGIFDHAMLTDFPLAFSPENLANCRIIERQGKIVSHAGVWPRTLVWGEHRCKAGIIIAVATDPEYRQQGLAAALMRDLHRLLHAEQYDLGILWTGVPDFYRRLDWEQTVPRGWMVALAAGQVPRGDSDVTVEPYDPARDLPDLIRLHEQEPMRMDRSPAEWSVLLRLPKINARVARQRGTVVAYGVCATASNKFGLIETAGTVPGVAAIVGDLVHEWQIHGMPHRPGATDGGIFRWLIPHMQPQLRDWAARMNLEPVPLESSKGKGVEMVYRVRADRVPEKLLRDLCVWGLDHA